MNLTEKEAHYLKDVDLVEATRRVRQEATRLLNDQGVSALSIVISNFFADIIEHPEHLTETARK